MNTKRAHAKWYGDLKKGNGNIRLNDAGPEMPYDAPSRFENGNETSPEELLAAAHAGCFSMALSNLLSEKGFVPESISTTADVTLEKNDKGFEISESSLNTKAVVPGIDETLFMKLAVEAKVNCPVSKALGDVRINMKADLVQ